MLEEPIISRWFRYRHGFSKIMSRIALGEEASSVRVAQRRLDFGGWTRSFVEDYKVFRTVNSASTLFVTCSSRPIVTNARGLYIHEFYWIFFYRSADRIVFFGNFRAIMVAGECTRKIVAVCVTWEMPSDRFRWNVRSGNQFGMFLHE